MMVVVVWVVMIYIEEAWNLYWSYFLICILMKKSL